MTDELLLEAIYAAPDDDAPRLVYADALLERGDPRGELIARQCQGDPATDLVTEHGDRFLGELAPILIASTFERGFLATAKIRQPRDDQSIAALLGHPTWRTVRELRGSTAIALHPSMTALRILEVESEPAYWPELLTGAARPITELHYQPNIEESWDYDGDTFATPDWGGVWTSGFSRNEFAALAACNALPALRRLVITGIPGNWFATILDAKLLDRVPLVESRNGPMHVKVAGGLAAITIARTAPPSFTDVVLQLVQALPDHLGIELHADPRFAGRPIIERFAGRRLRR